MVAEDVQDALDSIREEGTLVTFDTSASTFTDPDRPWLGSTSVPDAVECYMAFVDQATAAALIGQWKGDAEVSSSTRFGMIGNNGFEPFVGQHVRRDGKEDLVVKDIMVGAPADVPVFYVLEFNA